MAFELTFVQNESQYVILDHDKKLCMNRYKISIFAKKQIGKLSRYAQTYPSKIFSQPF